MVHQAMLSPDAVVLHQSHKDSWQPMSCNFVNFCNQTDGIRFHPHVMLHWVFPWNFEGNIGSSKLVSASLVPTVRRQSLWTAEPLLYWQFFDLWNKSNQIHVKINMNIIWQNTVTWHTCPVS